MEEKYRIFTCDKSCGRDTWKESMSIFLSYRTISLARFSVCLPFLILLLLLLSRWNISTTTLHTAAYNKLKGICGVSIFPVRIFTPIIFLIYTVCGVMIFTFVFPRKGKENVEEERRRYGSLEKEEKRGEKERNYLIFIYSLTHIV